MEDAMILNKSSMERGLAHATLYKTETVDLHDEKSRTSEFGVKHRTPEEAAVDRAKVRPNPQGAFGATSPQNVVSRPGSSAAPRCAGVLAQVGGHMGGRGGVWAGFEAFEPPGLILCMFRVTSTTY